MKDPIQNLKILVVEDNPVNAILLTYLLDNNHIAYDITGNGSTALSLFNKGNYRLVVTDINLPGLSGVDLAKAIRLHRDEEKKNVPVIAVTANRLEEKEEEYRRAGITGIIQKPYNEKHLLDILRQYMHII